MNSINVERKKQGARKVWLLWAAAVVAAFAIGFGWQYVRAESMQDRMEALEHELAFAEMQATLGAATIEAQRGNYEVARQLASSFYTSLQEHSAEARQEAREPLRSILQQRDAMITELSRANPESGAMLARMFTRYRAAIGDEPSAEPVPAPPPAPGEAGEAGP